MVGWLSRITARAEPVEAEGAAELRHLPVWIGVIERIGYTTALIYDTPGFIAVWLTIKMLGAAPWDHTNPTSRSRYQRNLVLTGVSLGYAVLGWRVVVWLRAEDPHGLEA